MRDTWKSRFAAAALALAALTGAQARAAEPAKAAPAAAKKKAPVPPTPPGAPGVVDDKTVDVAAARTDLLGGDVEKAAAAAKRLGTTRQPAALEALLDGLALGLHPRVAAAALDSVGYHKSPAAIDVLAQYVKNRNPEVRSKAVLALGQIDDKRARSAAWTAFHDGDKAVRAAACKVAETTKDKGATEPLVKLLVKGDEATVTALAALATPDLARKLGELIGQAPDDLLARTLGLVVLRPDFGKEEVYVEVITTIGKIPGAEAVVALTNFISATPEKPPRLSRRKAQEIYELRLSGGN
jgi:HEAT repeat protein